MNKKRLFGRLIALAKMPGGSRSPIIVSDLVDQENLCNFQDNFQQLLVEVANDPEVQGADLLKAAFPYLFVTTDREGTFPVHE